MLKEIFGLKKEKSEKGDNQGDFENSEKIKKQKKERAERIHRRIGLWLVLVSLIILIGILLFMWMF